MKKWLKYLSVFFSLLFLILGILGVLKLDSNILGNLINPNGVAIQFFILSFIAALLPFVKEISIFGNNIKILEEIRKTNTNIKSLETTINSQKNASRDFLINAFTDYIKTFPIDEQEKQIINLNQIYFKELKVSVLDVKKALNNWINQNNNKNIPPISDLSDTIDSELIQIIKLFQDDMGLRNTDGIFGYYTCDKLRYYFN